MPVKKIWKLIPSHMDNRRMIALLDLLTRVPSFSLKKNLSANVSAFSSHKKVIAQNGGYIEDQDRYRDMRFGHTTIRFAGCEIIAAYNALQDLSGRSSYTFPELIALFEKRGIIFSGLFGTSPKALCSFFRQEGFPVLMTSDERSFSHVADRSDTLILTYYNDRNDIRAQIHTVQVSKKDGAYTPHNLYGSGVHPVSYSSVDDLLSRINGGSSRGISMIGISKP